MYRKYEIDLSRSVPDTKVKFMIYVYQWYIYSELRGESTVLLYE